MSQEEKPLDEKAIQKKYAIDLFNGTWAMMEKKERSEADDDRMLNMAHASRYHWGEVGTEINLARGEWLLARVYAVLGRVEPSLYHALKSLACCEKNDFGDFDLAFAYEALARTYAIAGDESQRDKYLQLANEAGKLIAEEDDRDLFFSDLKSVPGYRE
jgi:hypothetical protein